MYSALLALLASALVQSAFADTDRAKCVRANVSGWLDDTGMILPVEGYEIPGGIVLDGADTSTSPIFLTKQFFDQTRLPIPPDAKRTRLWTYRYYQRGSKNEKATRGSGRDHLIAANSSDPEKRFIAVKGSGTNPHYSKVNGDFDALDFRKNGLQSVTDRLTDEHGGAIVEWILAQKFERMGIPVVPHRNLRLLPASLQKAAEVRKSKYWLAVQNDRVLTNPRESFRELPPTRSQKLKLASSMYFHNITHGALNPENLTSNAQILDVGHVTFGYEFTSGVYRCTICRGVHGSTADRTLKGVLDYYFPANWTRGSNRDTWDRVPYRATHAAYMHRLEAKDATDFMQEIGSNINLRKFRTALTAEEADDLMALTQENLTIGSNEDYPFADAQAKLLGVSPDTIRSAELSPRFPALSIRLYLQITAMRKLLGEAEYASARDRALSLVRAWKEKGTRESMADGPEVAERLFVLFDRMIKEKDPSKEELLKVFETQVPASEVQNEVRVALDKAQNLDEAATALKAIIKKHEAPIQMDPKKFLEAFLGN